MTRQHFQRHHKRCLDAVTSDAYAGLRIKGGVRAAFTRLIEAVSARSDLMATPRTTDGRFVQIEALYNLAAFHREWIAGPETWAGAHGHVLPVAGALARHLLGRYPTPTFLASVWFGADTVGDRERRRWFIEHARGRRFRSLVLPMTMTRRMEHIFLHGPDHLDVVASMRRAEVLGSGGSPALAAALIATALGRTLERPELWRPFIESLARCEADLDLAQIPRLVEYVASLRGVVPTSASIATLVSAADQWHALRRVHGRHRFAWSKSRWRDFVVEVALEQFPRRMARWQIVELLDSHELVQEGQAMRNCVATYAHRCRAGSSTIWSLRRADLPTPRSVLTIEVDPRRGRIVQVKGRQNRNATAHALELLKLWAQREELTYPGL